MSQTQSVSILNTQSALSEMLVHTAMCTHPNPQKLLIIAPGCGQLCSQLDRYHYGSLDMFEDGHEPHSQETLYDVIIACDIEWNDVAKLALKIASLLDANGVAVLQDSTDKSSLVEYKSRLEEFKKYFFVVKPFELGKYLFVSRRFHPTADIVLDRADLMDDLSYYNADWHIASFTMPTFMKQALAKVVEY